MSERLGFGLFVGVTACAGGLLMVVGGDTKQVLGLLPERQAAALSLLVEASLILSGIPAGFVAGKHVGRTPLPLWSAMGGAFLTPLLAWFAGFDPAWPRCWAAAWALGFAGSWIGLGVGLAAGKKDQEKANGGGEICGEAYEGFPFLPRKSKKSRRR